MQGSFLDFFLIQFAIQSVKFTMEALEVYRSSSVGSCCNASRSMAICSWRSFMAAKMELLLICLYMLHTLCIVLGWKYKVLNSTFAFHAISCDFM